MVVVVVVEGGRSSSSTHGTRRLPTYMLRCPAPHLYEGGFVVESFVPASVYDHATYVLKQQVLEAKCQGRHAGPVGVANLPT